MTGLALAVSITGAALAQGTRPCPVDGERLRLPTQPAWNTAGGEDSDGCRYAVDETDRRRVLDTVDVVQCPRCRVCFLPDQLSVELSDAERKQLSEEAVANERAGASRWEIAAWTGEALGERGLPAGTNVEARLGQVFLRAAWDARAVAALGTSDGGYRPRTLTEAREQLEALERSASADPRLDPEVLRLDGLLDELEDARAGLDPPADISPLARRALLRTHTHLADLERRLLEQKEEALTAAGGRATSTGDAEPHEALARAWIRFGSPARWRPLLDQLSSGETHTARARAMQRACEEEARLLGRASLHFQIAVQSEKALLEQARLHFLIGDGARRRGLKAEAKRSFERAAQLDPAGEPGRRARALLRGP